MVNNYPMYEHKKSQNKLIDANCECAHLNKVIADGFLVCTDCGECLRRVMEGEY